MSRAGRARALRNRVRKVYALADEVHADAHPRCDPRRTPCNVYDNMLFHVEQFLWREWRVVQKLRGTARERLETLFEDHLAQFSPEEQDRRVAAALRFARPRLCWTDCPVQRVEDRAVSMERVDDPEDVNEPPTFRRAVPGGWLYWMRDGEVDGPMTFVPEPKESE